VRNTAAADGAGTNNDSRPAVRSVGESASGTMCRFLKVSKREAVRGVIGVRSVLAAKRGSGVGASELLDAVVNAGTGVGAADTEGAAYDIGLTGGGGALGTAYAFWINACGYGAAAVVGTQPGAQF
jgi:hypothetical protein